MRTREKFLRRYLNGNSLFGTKKKTEERKRDPTEGSTWYNIIATQERVERSRSLAGFGTESMRVLHRDTPTLRGVLVAACCRGGDGSGDAPEWVGPISGDLLSSGAAAEAE